MNNETKICNDCKVEKPVSEFTFRKRKGRENGYYNAYCKPCNSKRTVESNKKHAERARNYNKEYRKKNLEKYKLWEKQARQRQLEKNPNFYKEFYAKNKQRLQERNKIYYRKNKDKFREWQRKYRKNRNPLRKFRRWLGSVSSMLLNQFNKLNVRNQKKVREEILHRIKVHRKFGRRIDFDTVREIITDAKKGLFFFEKSEKQKPSIISRNYSQRYTNYD